MKAMTAVLLCSAIGCSTYCDDSCGVVQASKRQHEELMQCFARARDAAERKFCQDGYAGFFK